MTEKKRKFVYNRSIYYVTPSGNVENSSNHRLKKLDNGKGYKMVSLHGKGKRKNFYIHRLVAMCYLDNPNGFPEINHKDGNKSNNDVSNLEWVSKKMNIKHALINGLSDSGAKNWNANLTSAQARLVYKAYWAGIPSREIMDAFNVSRHTVCDIANGRIYKLELQKLEENDGVQNF